METVATATYDHFDSDNFTFHSWQKKNIHFQI
jgi:chitinase domain-containing protein 1